MRRFLRLSLFVLGGYLLYVLLYRPPHARAHLICLAKLEAAAAAVWIFERIIEMGSRAAKLALEIGFAAGALVYLAYALPAGGNSPPPLKAFVERHAPPRVKVRSALNKIGISPLSKPGRWLVSRFPH